MEYMKLEGFLGNAVSKLINKGVESKVGFNPNILLNSFTLKTDVNPENSDELVVVNLTAQMTQEAFDKLIEEATK